MFCESNKEPRSEFPLTSSTTSCDEDDADCVAVPARLTTCGNDISVVDDDLRSCVSLSHEYRKNRSRLLARCKSRVARKTLSSTSPIWLSSARSTSALSAPYSDRRVRWFEDKSSTLNATSANARASINEISLCEKLPDIGDRKLRRWENRCVGR